MVRLEPVPSADTGKAPCSAQLSLDQPSTVSLPESACGNDDLDLSDWTHDDEKTAAQQHKFAAGLEAKRARASEGACSSFMGLAACDCLVHEQRVDIRHCHQDLDHLADVAMTGHGGDAPLAFSGRTRYGSVWLGPRSVSPTESRDEVADDIGMEDDGVHHIVAQPSPSHYFQQSLLALSRKRVSVFRSRIAGALCVLSVGLIVLSCALPRWLVREDSLLHVGTQHERLSSGVTMGLFTICEDTLIGECHACKWREKLFVSSCYFLFVLNLLLPLSCYNN